MLKNRIVQREDLYFVQHRKLFFWFYETSVNFAHKHFDFVCDSAGFIGFASFGDAKDYLEKIVNSETKVVYELET